MKYRTKVSAWLRLKDGEIVQGCGVEFDGNRLAAGAAKHLLKAGVIEPVADPEKTTKEVTASPVRKVRGRGRKSD